MNVSSIQKLYANAIGQVNTQSGALSAVSQVGAKVVEAVTAASLEGVPAEERSIALKYLNPLLEFCRAADLQYGQGVLREQGKVIAYEELMSAMAQDAAAPTVQEESAATTEAKSG